MWRSGGGRRGSYLLVSAEKAQVATYASTHCVHTAIKHFSKAFSKDLTKLKIPENFILVPFQESRKFRPPENFRLYGNSRTVIDVIIMFSNSPIAQFSSGSSILCKDSSRVYSCTGADCL